MAMSAKSSLAFGELYRNGGKVSDGQTVIPSSWIELSWQPRTRSRFTGDQYGYGWFLREISDRDVRYAWGYGGQMLYVVPELELTVVMTSDDANPAGRTGYRDDLHRLMASIIAVVAGDALQGGARDLGEHPTRSIYARGSKRPDCLTNEAGLPALEARAVEPLQRNSPCP